MSASARNLVTRAAAKSSRLCLSFTSWFCLPDQGMTNLEVLCRASAFVLPALGKSKFSHHVLTVSHAASPWRWPRLYSDEWLRFVNDDACYYTTEMRFPDGTALTQVDMQRHVYLHPFRDLAVVHFEEDSSLNLLKQLGLEDGLQLLPSERQRIPPGTSFELHGHHVQHGGMYASEDDDRLVQPLSVAGTLFGRSQHQTFSRTERVLPDGMCGGPLLADGQVAGLLEGIVPADHTDAELQNMAVSVDSDEIRRFLLDIESGAVLPREVGRVALDFIGKDQDPTKMDLKDVLG